MRFEEVSPPVESRLVTIATSLLGNLATEINGLLGVFNSTLDDVSNAASYFDTANATTAATRALAPGGLTSLFLFTALFLHVLKALHVRFVVRRLTRYVQQLANGGMDDGAHAKAE
jgi:hypothetical protein